MHGGGDGGGWFFLSFVFAVGRRGGSDDTRVRYAVTLVSVDIVSVDIVFVDIVFVDIVKGVAERR